VSATVLVLVAEFAGQVLQLELPGVSWYVGARQSKQVSIEVAAVAVENFPALQSMQERTEFVAPAVEYVPAPHTAHDPVRVVASPL